MAKQKFRINLFDIFVVVVIIITTLIFFVSYNNKPNLGDKVILVEIKISDLKTIETVMPVIKSADLVYFSGTKYPVKQISYKTEPDSNGLTKYLDITVEGPGNIVDGNSIFNGQRVYVNQKVEIRADYYAQGYVVDFGYEN